MKPRHGYTADGTPVHSKTHDHHRDDSAYQRFNKRFALAITKAVGSMTTAYLFSALSLTSLPAVLVATGWVPRSIFPPAILSASVIALVAWVAQTFIQLVLLPVIMVGQNVQNEAADARSTKTFEDVEALRQDVQHLVGLLDPKRRS